VSGPSTRLRTGARILVVEDEAQLRLALKRYLTGLGYMVHDVGDAEAGLQELSAFKPDVILLDLLLPGMSGVDFCREVRQDRETPIVVLSAVNDEVTKIKAMDEGADDYLTKPFSMNELFARIRVALRHAGAATGKQPVFTAEGLRIDLERRQVWVDQREVHLTPTEYSLLQYLATHSGKVVTHPMILRAVWGGEYAEDTAVLRTYIAQLRDKLDSDKPNRFIRTEPRIGYRFLPQDES
jgi:two-component system KDP operon response regulator KdpE